MVLRKACARAPLQGLSESTRKPLKAYLRKGVIPLNASLLKGTAFLLHSKKHYNRRDRAEGGAEGALAPPLFCKNKNKLNKK